MAKQYEVILEQTLFESDGPPNYPVCSATTLLGEWNSTTKSVDSKEIVLEAGFQYSIQVYESKYRTAKDTKKYNLRISKVIDDGQEMPIKPAIRRL